MHRVCRPVVALVALVLVACSGSGGGQDGPDASVTPGGTPVELGADLAATFPAAPPACTGTVRGGTFASPDGAAQVYVADGAIPRCADVTTTPTLAREETVPAGLLSTTAYEIGATSGVVGYRFDLGVGGGFDTNAAGAVTLVLPYDASAVDEADRANAARVFVRIVDVDRDLRVDVHGKVVPGVAGPGTVTVELRGLPSRFVAAVVYRPGRNALAVTGTTVADAGATSSALVTDPPPWPNAKSWCVLFDADSPSLRAAVTERTGSPEPTTEEIAALLRATVGTAATGAQQTFEAQGFRAPYLYVATDPSEACPELGGQPRYEITVTDQESSNFTWEDPEEPTSPSGRHYGRIYLQVEHAFAASGDAFGGTLGVVAHELFHAVQHGYDAMFHDAGKGYREGTATTMGVAVPAGNVAKVRSHSAGETYLLSNWLTVDSDVAAYSNQDFFAWVGLRYGSGGLAWLAPFFQGLRDGLEAEGALATDTATGEALVERPGYGVMWKVTDGALRTAVGKGLLELWSEFVRERALTHDAASVFGRAGETTSGFAADLFHQGGAGMQRLLQVPVDADGCSVDKGGRDAKFVHVCPMSAAAVRVFASPAAGPDGGTLTVTVEPSSGSVGTNVTGWTWRNGALADLASTNTFAGFGAVEGDAVVVLILRSDLTPACDLDVRVRTSFACADAPVETPDATVTPDPGTTTGGSPDGCGTSGIPGCNYHPAKGYWNRMCEEYPGSHWAGMGQQLQSACQLTSDAIWCPSGCPRVKLLGSCSASMGENAEVQYFYYDDVTYSDPQASCAKDGGSWN